MRPKNDQVREALLRSAKNLFARKGYATTTMSSIAKEGGMSTSNLYCYYDSKLAIMLEIYEPWLKRQVLALEKRVAAKSGAEAKIRRLVRGILDDIANDHEGYTRALVQALSISDPSKEYNAELLLWVEQRIQKTLSQAANFERSGLDLEAVSHMLMLMFDGVGLRRNLPPRPKQSAAMQEMLISMLLSCAKQLEDMA